MRIGMLTSGGDCQGLNAALRGVAKTLFENVKDVKIYGYLDGYHGLIYGNYKTMHLDDFSGILTLGGTILGTSRQPFKRMNETYSSDSEETKFEAMIRNYEMQKLDCLVILGGNGTHKTAEYLSRQGLNVVSLPKTIDNDIWGTDMTFGFQSAVDIATAVIDGIHTTATSHSRVFIIELMGHKAGWLNLHAGLAGGADIILIPEIPYHLNSIQYVLNDRRRRGRRFSIIAMAEGAISYEDSLLSKDELKQKKADLPYDSVSYELADNLNKIIPQEVRVVIPGHYQRGGSPVAYDRVFATRLGVHAAENIMAGNFGVMVNLKDGEIGTVPLSEVAHRLKTVPVDSEIVQMTRKLGIYFGDEEF